MILRKGDFYCGAFLSILLNNNDNNIVPVLFDESDNSNRRIYDICTNRGDYRVYIKYSENPSSNSRNKNSNLWTFTFTERQLDEVESIVTQCKDKKILFVFICALPKLKDSKFAVIKSDEVLKCIDLNRVDKYKNNQNIKIKLIKKHRKFDVYGTNHSDENNKVDNTMKIDVNSVKDLI